MIRTLVVFCGITAAVSAQLAGLGDAPVATPPPAATSPKLTQERSAAVNMAVPATWYDISTRTAAQQAYLSDYVPTTNIPLGFTGNVAVGVAGDTSAAYKAAMIQRFNFYRAMAGVPANITLNSTLNSRAQYGALMMAANGQISHTPPNTWLFWTQAGYDTLSSSNVCQGQLSDPGCVEQFLADQGSNNPAVGHRRWMLFSRAKQIGTGDVPNAIPGFLPNLWNATYVIDRNNEGFWLSSPAATRDGFVAWPPKGFVPYQLNFPRWSFSISGYPGPDFSGAVVKVTKNGQTTTATLEPQEFNATAYGQSYAGDNTIVFNPDGRDTSNASSYVPAVPAQDTPYTVSVENVKVGGVTQSPYVYTVTIFNPATNPTNGCSLSSSSTTAQAGYQNVTVNITGSGCGAWTASSSSSWAAVYPLSGSGAGSVNITIYPNFSAGQRNTTVTVAGTPYTITQPSLGGTADERFVGQSYFFLLGRMATPSEITFQVQNGLSSGRASLVNNFLNSAEFNQTGRYVAGLYVGLLNRDAEFGGWQFQRNALLQNQVDRLALVRNFITGLEFQLKNPNQTDADYVRMLYNQVLLRQPSQAEVDFQVANLNGDRVGLASRFLISQEFSIGTGPRLLAFLYYATMLNRDPNSAELQTMITALSSASDAQRLALISQILSSSEYLALLQ